MVPVGLGIAVTIVIGRCGNVGMTGCTVPRPAPVEPVPAEPVPLEPVPLEPVPLEPVPVDAVPAPPLVPVPAAPLPVAVPVEPELVLPVPADDRPAPEPPLPLVSAAVPAVTPVAAAPATGAWCTGRITATATAAADAILPAMAAALASVVISDLLLVRPRRLTAAAGLFVTPVGVVSSRHTNNFFAVFSPALLSGQAGGSERAPGMPEPGLAQGPTPRE